MEPRAIAKAPEGEGCPRCGGCVYAAEQMLARGRVSDITKWLKFLNLIHLSEMDWFIKSVLKSQTSISSD